MGEAGEWIPRPHSGRRSPCGARCSRLDGRGWQANRFDSDALRYKVYGQNKEIPVSEESEKNTTGVPPRARRREPRASTENASSCSSSGGSSLDLSWRSDRICISSMAKWCGRI